MSRVFSRSPRFTGLWIGVGSTAARGKLRGGFVHTGLWVRRLGWIAGGYLRRRLGPADRFQGCL